MKELTKTVEHKLEQINNIGIFLFGFFCGITDYLFSGAYWNDSLQATITALLCAIGAGAGNEIWKMIKKWFIERLKKRKSKLNKNETNNP